MENILSYIKYGVTTIGGLLGGLLGGWDVVLQVLVLFVVFDYITGLTAAWCGKELDSNVGLWGIAKKILMFVPVALGYWLDVAIGTEILRNLVVFFYIANEGLSILENLGRAGIPIPAPLRAALEQLKQKNEQASGGDNNVS